MTPDETKAYKKGYAAGRKRVGAEIAKWEKIHADITISRARTFMEREDAFFNAALVGLLSNGGTKWTMEYEGKPGVTVSDLRHYVELANRFARHTMTKRWMP